MPCLFGAAGPATFSAPLKLCGSQISLPPGRRMIHNERLGEINAEKYETRGLWSDCPGRRGSPVAALAQLLTRGQHQPVCRSPYARLASLRSALSPDGRSEE